MFRYVQPKLTGILVSDEVRQWRRRWHEWRRLQRHEPHRATIFLKLSDPYSYLLVQALPDLLDRFALAPRYYLVQQLPDEMFTEAELWQRNAVQDCASLARLYGLSFDARRIFPDPHQLSALEAEAVHCLRSGGNLISLLASRLEQLWRGDAPAQNEGQGSPELRQDLREYFRASERVLDRMGHYAGATLHYGGEWYWGLDRLDHLEQRLLDLGVQRHPGVQVRYNRQYRDFCTRGSRDDVPETRREQPLELYFSIRSPFSYLGLEKARRLCEHYDIPLEIKPVLPMAMRGMVVPFRKKVDIFFDAAREAAKAGISFGQAIDPLGEGVSRCYQLCTYAIEKGKLQEYMLSTARGVWSEGVDISTDSGLGELVERAGLDWQEARGQLGQNGWTVWAQRHLDELYRLGFWGVPSFRYGDLRVWGQDRMWLLEEAIVGDRRQARTS